MALQSQTESQSIWIKLQCGYTSCNETWKVFGSSYCRGSSVKHPGKQCKGNKKQYCKLFEKKIGNSNRWNVYILSCSEQAHEILKGYYPTEIVKSWIPMPDDQSVNRNVRSIERGIDFIAPPDQLDDTTDVEMDNNSQESVDIIDLHEANQPSVSPHLQNTSSHPCVSAIPARQISLRTGNNRFDHRSSPIAQQSNETDSDNGSRSSARDHNTRKSGRPRYRARHRTYKSLRRKQHDSNSDDSNDMPSYSKSPNKNKKKPARRSYTFEKRHQHNQVPSHHYALRSISGQENDRTLQSQQSTQSNPRNRNKSSVNKSDDSGEQSEEVKIGGSRSVSVSCSDKENDEEPTQPSKLLTIFTTGITSVFYVFVACVFMLSMNWTHIGTNRMLSI
eukprot:174996_1